MKKAPASEVPTGIVLLRDKPLSIDRVSWILATNNAAAASPVASLASDEPAAVTELRMNSFC